MSSKSAMPKRTLTRDVPAEKAWAEEFELQQSGGTPPAVLWQPIDLTGATVTAFVKISHVQTVPLTVTVDADPTTGIIEVAADEITAIMMGEAQRIFTVYVDPAGADPEYIAITGVLRPLVVA